MLPDLNRVIEQVSKEKQIGREIIVKALEEAMLAAAKKTFGQAKNLEAKFNPELGEVELFEIKTVVDKVEDPENQVTLEVARAKIDPEAEVGDELLAKLPSEKFGRIAAQAAKQNIIQRVRDAERDIIYNEFKGRKGELFSGIVQRFEKKNIIVNLGRTDDPAREGADPARALPQGRPHPCLHPRRRGHRQGAADRALAHAPGAPREALRAGGARDLRGHRRGEGRGPRAGRPGEDRRHLERPRRRSGRRLR